MEWLQAIILAFIQGLTEFLPISSSAHLILPAALFGWEDQGLAFDVAVHVGSLFAIILYFRKDIFSIAKAWFAGLAGRANSSAQQQENRLAWLIILATVPAGLAGLIFDDFIADNLRSTAVIATTTILFGILLWYSDSRGERSVKLENVNIKQAVIIGLSQAIALIPGTSRSGITMTAALLLGFTRDAAARFSFLLSVPLIAAAGLLKSKELLESGTAQQWELIGIASCVSFISAYACIHLFLSFLERIGFTPFVIYRLLLGLLLIGLLLAS